MAYPARPLGSFSGLFFQNLVIADPYSGWAVDLARLRHEKEILENGLANCVTYLHALRKRQARNERLLNFEPLPSRKKRKKIQQSKRELDKEIRNRERDEQAFLNNLRACKANVYIAEGHPYTPTDLSSTVTDCASSTTQYSYEQSEPMAISWKGWTDDAVLSPFDRQQANTTLVKEVAPDEFVEVPEDGAIVIRDIDHSSPLLRRATADAKRAPYLRSSLSPAAPVFEPVQENTSRGVSLTERRLDKLNDLSWLDNKRLHLKSAPAGEEVEVCASMQGLTIHTTPHAERRGSGTWCNTSPQQSPHKVRGGGPLGRARTNSL